MNDMSNHKQSWLRRLFSAGLSPAGLLVRAALVVVFFAICHIAGWREHTTFLSGTSASADGGVNTSAVLGVIYMASYFGFVLLTPILALAAGILFVFDHRMKRREANP
jgi:TRAP-type C4-dicarboxylate transport system permease small subunit